jgi:hypothetical protein
MVRRIEISVEREVCCLTMHGSLVADASDSCPLCGQSLDASAPLIRETPAETLKEIPVKDETPK